MADQAAYHQQQHHYHQEHQQQHVQGQQNGPRDDQPGLEPAPTRYSTAPIPYSPEIQSPGVPTPLTDPKWVESQHYSVHGNPPPPPPEKRRILGLAVPIFWGLIVAFVIVLAGGIGGGVAAGLLAQKSDVSSSSESSPTPTTEGLSTTTTLGSLTAATAAAATSTTATLRTTSTAVGGVRPAPTDGGCPNINETAYTPTDANGKVMNVGSGSGQSFRQLCQVNYPSGANYGNPDIYDILKVYVTSFEECMTLCAAHNQAYNTNLLGGVVGSGGYCRSVAMIKLPGEYCYLKNGTGKSDTQGHAKDFVSAVLISGLES